MPEYLKQAPRFSPEHSEAVRATVSEMLSTIERDGAAAVRAYSRQLDDWDPPSFTVDQAAVDRAAADLDPSLRAHIAFAQQQIRAFAEAQLGTLGALEVQTLPGVTLGHRHI